MSLKLVSIVVTAIKIPIMIYVSIADKALGLNFLISLVVAAVVIMN